MPSDTQNTALDQIRAVVDQLPATAQTVDVYLVPCRSDACEYTKIPGVVGLVLEHRPNRGAVVRFPVKQLRSAIKRILPTTFEVLAIDNPVRGPERPWYSKAGRVNRFAKSGRTEGLI